MAEHERDVLIQSVLEKRAAQQAHDKSVDEAKKEVPALREKLSSLIRSNVKQKTKVISFNQWSDMILNMRQKDEEKEHDTSLKYTVNEGGEVVKVTVSSSQYPNEKGENAEFIINVHGHDSYLKIKKSGVVIESKEKISNMPSDIRNVIIGHHYNSRPKFRDNATEQDIKDYRDLLNVLIHGENVTFVGKTPDKIEVDESTRPNFNKSRSKVGRFKPNEFPFFSDLP